MREKTTFMVFRAYITEPYYVLICVCVCVIFTRRFPVTKAGRRGGILKTNCTEKRYFLHAYVRYVRARRAQ
jgi:hypothetical protein